MDRLRGGEFVFVFIFFFVVVVVVAAPLLVDLSCKYELTHALLFCLTFPPSGTKNYASQSTIHPITSNSKSPSSTTTNAPT